MADTPAKSPEQKLADATVIYYVAMGIMSAVTLAWTISSTRRRYCR